MRLTPYLFAVNQLEAARPPALTFLMLQAASHSVRNALIVFSLRCSTCVHCGDGLLVSLWAFLILRVALIASTDMPSPDTA